MSESDQSRLLAIVESWNLNEKPEFRGFRCALCQSYMTASAWHHWLREGGYKTPVHFCDTCENDFKNGIVVKKERHSVDRSAFDPAFAEGTEAKLDTISSAWNLDGAPIYKKFACDACGKDLENAEGYHVWRNKEGTLVEYHFDRFCGNSLGI